MAALAELEALRTAGLVSRRSITSSKKYVLSEEEKERRRSIGRLSKDKVDPYSKFPEPGPEITSRSRSSSARKSKTSAEAVKIPDFGSSLLPQEILDDPELVEVELKKPELVIPAPQPAPEPVKVELQTAKVITVARPSVSSESAVKVDLGSSVSATPEALSLSAAKAEVVSKIEDSSFSESDLNWEFSLRLLSGQAIIEYQRALMMIASEMLVLVRENKVLAKELKRLRVHRAMEDLERELESDFLNVIFGDVSLEIACQVVLDVRKKLCVLKTEMEVERAKSLQRYHAKVRKESVDQFWSVLLLISLFLIIYNIL